MQTIKTIVLIITVLYLNPNFLKAQSQTKVDSLLALIPGKSDLEASKIYNKIRILYFNRDINKAKEYLDLEVKHANLSKDKSAILSAKIHTSNHLYILGQMDEAKVILTELFNEELIISDSLKYAKLLHLMASINGEQGDFKLAAANEIKSLKINEKLGASPIAIADGYYFLGNIEGYLRNYVKSNEYLIKARDIYNKEGDIEYEMIMKMLIGLNLLETGSINEAKEIFENTVEFYRKHNSPNDLARALSNLGNSEMQLDNDNIALKHYQEAMRIAEANKDIGVASEMYQRLGDIYTKKKQNKKAISFLSKAMVNDKLKGDRESLSRTYRILSNNYSGIKDYEKAFEYYKKHNTIKDSIYSAENQATINELEIEYQTEKKEQEIILLKIKEEKSKLQKSSLIGAILALLLLSALLFYAMRQRLKRTRLSKQKSDQELKFKKRELDLKKQELMAFALQLANKNEVLESIKGELEIVKKEDTKTRSLQKIVNTIDLNQNDNSSWDEFRHRFQSVHSDFEGKVVQMFPSVSNNELRLMALLKMNLSSKEIANILNISAEGIKKARYRLRKKMGMETSDSLEDLILSI